MGKTGKEAKGAFAAALEAKRAMTPDEGYNVVGVDSFEPPGEELYLVGHYDTWEEAEAARKRCAGGTWERFYVYPLKREDEEEGGSP